MRVELDFFEMLYLLESCLRGSHLRSTTVERFSAEFWGKLTEKQRNSLYRFVLRDVYDGKFEPRDSMCGQDVWLMERYDPDNQYEVTVVYDGVPESARAFRHKENGRYYVRPGKYIAPEYITKIEKLKSDEEKDS